MNGDASFVLSGFFLKSRLLDLLKFKVGFFYLFGEIFPFFKMVETKILGDNGNINR